MQTNLTDDSATADLEAFWGQLEPTSELERHWRELASRESGVLDYEW